MVYRTPQELLQPALLDRLTDHDPSVSVEAADQRVLTATQLLSAVKRDLGWLLNVTQLSTSVDLGEAEHVSTSILNYGIPELAGVTRSSLNLDQLAQQIHEAITRFEPRFVRGTLQVQPQKNAGNAVVLLIRGEVRAHPMPLVLWLRTEIDLENGNATLIDEEGHAPVE